MKTMVAAMGKKGKSPEKAVSSESSHLLTSGTRYCEVTSS